MITIQESDAESGVVFKAQANESVEYSLGRGSDPALRINDQGEVILLNRQMKIFNHSIVSL